MVLATESFRVKSAPEHRRSLAPRDLGISDARFAFLLPAAGIKEVSVIESDEEVRERPERGWSRAPIVKRDPMAKKAPRYQVLMHTDKRTCICYMNEVLAEVFNINWWEGNLSASIIEEARDKGTAIVKIFPSKEIAESKAKEANGKYNTGSCDRRSSSKHFTYEKV